MAIYDPEIVPIFEGGDTFSTLDVIKNETFDFRLQLITFASNELDVTDYTLTSAAYNSTGTLTNLGAITLTKEINELGIVKVAGYNFSIAGTFNLYIIATNGGLVRKFGPYKVKVRNL